MRGRKKPVLVTGGAGFIGSFVVEEAIRLGFKVVVLDDLSGGFKDNVDSRAHFVKGSIHDDRLIDSLFRRHRFRYVYHLAAYAAEGLSHFIKQFNYQNNLSGSVNLINASVNYGIECFVFTSSIAVYGKNHLPMREDMTPEPEDPYGIAKFAVEEELKISKKMFDLNYVIFRPHNVYGERQNIGDKYRNVIGIFMNQIMRHEPITIFGDGRQTRAFTYIRDVAPAIAKAPLVKKGYNQVFNIGASERYTLIALAKAVIKAMGLTRYPIVYLSPRKEVKHAYSDHFKVEKIFNCKPRYPLEEGLRRMASWAREHGARESKKFEKIEVRKNLPAIWR